MRLCGRWAPGARAWCCARVPGAGYPSRWLRRAESRKRTRANCSAHPIAWQWHQVQHFVCAGLLLSDDGCAAWRVAALTGHQGAEVRAHDRNPGCRHPYGCRVPSCRTVHLYGTLNGGVLCVRGGEVGRRAHRGSGMSRASRTFAICCLRRRLRAVRRAKLGAAGIAPGLRPIAQPLPAAAATPIARGGGNSASGRDR